MDVSRSLSSTPYDIAAARVPPPVKVKTESHLLASGHIQRQRAPPRHFQRTPRLIFPGPPCPARLRSPRGPDGACPSLSGRAGPLVGSCPPAQITAPHTGGPSSRRS